MKPRVYDSLTRYLVDSESNPNEVHLVDLSGYNFNGECSCQHFSLKIKPALDEQAKPSDLDSHRCKHIKIVREFVLNHVIAAYEEISTQPTNE